MYTIVTMLAQLIGQELEEERLGKVGEDTDGWIYGRAQDVKIFYST